MRALLLAVSLCAAVSAHAGFVFDNGQVRVQFSDGACEVPAIADVLSQFGPSKKATVIHQGNVIAACWLMDGTDFFIVDAQGGFGGIPGSQVKVAKDA